MSRKERGRRPHAYSLDLQRDEFGVEVTAEDQPDLREVRAVYQSGHGRFLVVQRQGRIVGTIGLIMAFGEREGALRDRRPSR